MSVPTRWKDSPDAPIGMRELLGSAKRTRPLDEETRTRVGARVAKMAIVPAAAASATIGIWAKLAAAAAIGLAAAGTVVVTTHGVSSTGAASTTPAPAVEASPMSIARAKPDEPPPPSTEEPVVAPEGVVPTPVAPTPVAIVPRANPTTASQPAKPVGEASSPPSPSPSPSESAAASVWIPEAPPRTKSTLGSELGLLEDAKRHMERSPETSLAALAEHRALHPSGVLASERDLMELDALRRTGRADEARLRAKAWLARDPAGIHAVRVRQILSTLE